MSDVNTGDWPIDPALVDGPELADRLNRLYDATLSGLFVPTRPTDAREGLVFTKAAASGYDLTFFDGSNDIPILNINGGSISSSQLATSSTISQALSGYLPLTGGRLTGDLTLAQGDKLRLTDSSNATRDAVYFSGSFLTVGNTANDLRLRGGTVWFVDPTTFSSSVVFSSAPTFNSRINFSNGIDVGTSLRLNSNVPLQARDYAGTYRTLLMHDTASRQDILGATNTATYLRGQTVRVSGPVSMEGSLSVDGAGTFNNRVNIFAAGGASPQGIINVRPNNNDLQIGTVTGADLSFLRGNSEKLRVSSSETSVASQLRVYATGSTSVQAVINPNGIAGRLYMGSSTNHDVHITRNGDSRLMFFSGAAELVGSIGTGRQQFIVANNSGPGGPSSFTAASTTGTQIDYDTLIVKAAGSDSTSKVVFGVRKGSGADYNYTLRANGTSTGGSDIRFKKDVSSLGSMLDKALALRPVTFRWKSDADGDDLLMGLIAQEVEEVLPELIDTDPGSGRKHLYYGHVPIILLKALQELTARVAALEEGQTS